MRDRRGFAMLAALWLVVAIAVVALQFSLDAKERRVLGIAAAERGTGRASSIGALALMQARLDYMLRNGPVNSALAGTRSGDPWLGIDSTMAGPLYIDSMEVDVQPLDLGARLNINTINEDQFRTFFGLVLGDYPLADKLAQMIMDWRDVDDIARTNGDERDGYVKKGLLALPANTQFRAVSDLLSVEGMTQDIYDKVAGYLTTFGGGQVNLNTAPPAVLRALPGMTDVILANILSQRSRGLRIASVADVVPGASTGGRGGRGAQPTGAQSMATIQLAQLNQTAIVDTREVLLTFIAHPGPQAQPVKLQALVTRAGTTATLTWVQW